MKIKKNSQILLIIVIIGFCFLGISWLLTLNIHKKYRADNPVTTVPTIEECPNEGMVAYWKFDKIIDDFTPNSSGSKNNGKFQFWFHDLTKYVFRPPKIMRGINGNCLEFRGRQWITGGNSICYSAQKITIAVWVWQQSDNIKDRVIVPTIMAKSSWPYDGWWLCSTTKCVGGETRNREIDLGIAWGSGFTHVKSKYQLPLKEWHHIAVSMDNSQHEVQFYIDGKPYGKRHKNIHPWLINWNHDLMIGGYDGSGRWPWHGKLDDVRFYNKLLSSEEIYAIYSKTGQHHLEITLSKLSINNYYPNGL